MRRPGPRLLVDAALAVATVAGLLALTIRDTPALGDEVEIADPPPGIDRVVVQVAGAVASPGVVTIERGARVADAVTLAGGALPEADLGDVYNLPGWPLDPPFEEATLRDAIELSSFVE